VHFIRQVPKLVKGLTPQIKAYFSTPPRDSLFLLPVPSPDKGGGFGDGLAAHPCKKKTLCAAEESP